MTVNAAAATGAADPQEPEAHTVARDTVQGFPQAIAALASGLAEADAFELDRRLRGAIRIGACAAPSGSSRPSTQRSPPCCAS
jgi:hypothetical protein